MDGVRESTFEEEIRALKLDRHVEQRIIEKHNREIMVAVDRENQKLKCRDESDLHSEMERMKRVNIKVAEQNKALKNACFALSDVLKMIDGD